MSEKLLNVLIIEDDENDFILMLRALSKESMLVDAKRVDTAETLAQALDERKWDIIISDNNVPDRRVSPNSSMELARGINPNIPFVIVSGTIGEENAVKLMKLGVNDYILKDSLTRLAPAIKREVSEAASRVKKVEAEKRLLESEERYRMLSESIQDMFFAMDKQLICTFWNKTAEKMTHVRASSAIGKHLFEVLPQASSSPLKEKIFESINAMESNTIEIDFSIQGGLRHYQVTIYPSSEIHSVIVKDITAAKRITRQLKLVNEELETFIYRVSHDIRGPLASMQGIVNLAQTERFPTLAENLFSRIGQMTGRLEGVIRSLQDIVKIKQEDIELKSTNIQQVWEQAQASIGNNAVDCDFEIAEGIDRLLITDEKLLVLALQRILENAKMFSHPARKPHVIARFSKKDGKHHQLVVSDNGIGFSSDKIDKIFKMFYRGSEQSTGAGLGLYLALSAIEKLGGSIEAASVAYEGSVFTIKLPLDTKVELLKDEHAF